MIKFVKNVEVIPYKFIGVSDFFIKTGDSQYELAHVPEVKGPDFPASNLAPGGLFLYYFVNQNTGSTTVIAFLSEYALELFRTVITAPGVGGVKACDIIAKNAGQEHDFQDADYDWTSLKGLPEKAAFFLNSKKRRVSAKRKKSLPAAASQPLSPERQDAVDALVALGHKKKEAEEAVGRVAHVKGETSANIISKSLRKK